MLFLKLSDMKKLTLFFASVVFLTACSESDTMQEIVIDERYSMELPTSLSITHNLNDEASLQYQDIIKELYVIVIDEPKSEFNEALEVFMLKDAYTQDLEGYTSLVMDIFTQGVNIYESSEPQMTTINGLDAVLLSFEGNSDNVDVFFKFGIIEGADTYYQIMTWTLLNKKDRFREQMSEMIMTFKEL